MMLILPDRFVVSTWTWTRQELSPFLMFVLQLSQKIGKVELNVVVSFSDKLDVTTVQAGPEEARQRLVRKARV